VSFSPTGSRALSGSQDHTVRLWDLEQDRCWLPQGTWRSGQFCEFRSSGRRALSTIGPKQSDYGIWIRGDVSRLMNSEIYGQDRLLQLGFDKAIVANSDNTICLWHFIWDLEFPSSRLRGRSATVLEDFLYLCRNNAMKTIPRSISNELILHHCYDASVGKYPE